MTEQNKGATHYFQFLTETLNGLPTFELIDDFAFGFDFSIESIILVYESKGVSFYFDPNELTLKEINTNKLNLKHYRRNK